MNGYRLANALVVAGLLAATTSCAILHGMGVADPATIGHLEALQTASTTTDSCKDFVAYEQAKVDSKSPMRDSKSLKDMKRICDCFGKADVNVPLEVTACKDKIPVALAYEHKKKAK